MKVWFKKPLSPSYLLLRWIPTSQLELYVSSLTVPGHGVKYRLSEGPWPLSLVVVMFPEPLMGEEWQMTESHNFPADAQVQGMGVLDIHHAVHKGEEQFPEWMGWVKGDHKMLLWGLQKGTSYMCVKQELCLVPCDACTAREQNWWENCLLQQTQCLDIGRPKTEANLCSGTVNARSDSFSFGTITYVGIRLVWG